MHRQPLMYELNARLLIERLSRRRNRRVTLSAIGPGFWKSLADQGFQLVWLMGLWKRSAASRRVALADEGLRSAYGRALPGWRDADVQGSPYAVAAYRLDEALGGPDELTSLRASLADAGLRLVVDFVPNHLARDHPWTVEHPARFVQAAPGAGEPPEGFFDAGGRWLAHGRDPYFPPWTDTAQVDFFSPQMRAALMQELEHLSDVADGVRCDMAMLALNDVFDRVWGAHLGGRPRPDREFWEEAIGAVRARRPDFLFLAEAYWGLEGRLLELGFDFAYDKTLYDRLRHGDAAGIREHLAGDFVASGRAMHFVENHDEPRAAEAFGAERSKAAAAVALTIPGLRLVHDGQMAGRRARLPVQLVREPDEPPDEALMAFYRSLLEACALPVCRDGTWSLLQVAPPAGDGPASPVLAWSWSDGHERLTIVVNWSEAPSRAVVHGADTGDPERSVELGPWEVTLMRDKGTEGQRD